MVSTTCNTFASQGVHMCRYGRFVMCGMRVFVYAHKTMNVAASPDGVGYRIVPHHHIYTMRMQRHLAIAGLTCVAYVVTGPAVDSLLKLVVLAVFIYVVLGSFARAADARLGYWWGWLYGEPEYATWLDLLVDGILRRLTSVGIGGSSGTGSAIDTADNESRIRILPLESEQR
jgi:hypothetical protein